MRLRFINLRKNKRRKHSKTLFGVFKPKFPIYIFVKSSFRTVVLQVVRVSGYQTYENYRKGKQESGRKMSRVIEEFTPYSSSAT